MEAALTLTISTEMALHSCARSLDDVDDDDDDSGWLPALILRILFHSPLMTLMPFSDC